MDYKNVSTMIMGPYLYVQIHTCTYVYIVDMNAGHSSHHHLARPLSN